MKTKKIAFCIVILFSLLASMVSCSSEDENYEALNEEKTSLVLAKNSVEQFRNDLREAFAGSENGGKVSLTGQQVSSLEQSAINMLKSEGMYTQECQQLESKEKNGGYTYGGSISFYG